MWCDVMWCDMIWYVMIWYDMIWYDMTWHDVIWYDMIRYDTIWYMIWYDVIWYDMIWLFDKQFSSQIYFSCQVFVLSYSIDIVSNFSNGTIWCDAQKDHCEWYMIWFDTCDTMCCNITWFMLWYDTTRYDIPFDILYLDRIGQDGI